MLTLLLLLFIGFILLVKGANYLVDGASSLAKNFHIPEIVIGLTIISFGTSAPELIINTFASIAKKNEIVLGNIIGSNLLNGLLILGVAGIIRPLEVTQNSVWKEIPFVLVATIMLSLFCNDFFLSKIPVLSRWDASIFLFMFVIFMLYIYRLALVKTLPADEIKLYSRKKTIYLIVSGLLGLFLGGKLVVDTGVKLALSFGVSEKLIALTIISLGSSLPELITSAVAAYKNRPALVVGNVLGSNIFNIFLVLGISPLIHPVTFQPVLNTDLLLLLISSILLFLFMFTGKKHKLDRWEAFLFLFFYSGYFFYLLKRG